MTRFIGMIAVVASVLLVLGLTASAQTSIPLFEYDASRPGPCRGMADGPHCGVGSNHQQKFQCIGGVLEDQWSCPGGCMPDTLECKQSFNVKAIDNAPGAGAKQ